MLLILFAMLMKVLDLS